MRQPLAATSPLCLPAYMPEVLVQRCVLMVVLARRLAGCKQLSVVYEIYEPLSVYVMSIFVRHQRSLTRAAK